MNILSNFIFTILSKFLFDRRGNFAVLVGVLAVPLMVSIGAATDYSRLVTQRSSMQEISDGAALAAATELSISKVSSASISEVVKAYVSAHDADLDVNVVVDQENQTVEVFLAKHWEPMMVHYVNKNALPIKTSAKAANAGENTVCILALDETAPTTLILRSGSTIKAESCSVYSNSTSEKGVILRRKAILAAKSVCSAGGYVARNSPDSTQPIVDCPQVPDPLAKRNFQSDNTCDYTNVTINKKNVTLQPGNYCGGLLVQNYSDVTLKSGLYKFIDGPLIIDSHARVAGMHVTLQLYGEKSGLQFTNSSFIDFSAMKTGVTAGILILADDTVPTSEIIKIQSEDAKQFTGLIYTPNQRVEIGANTQQGDACAKGGIHGPNCKHLPEFCETSFGHFSDWTAIISRKIRINKGVELIMNTDFDSSTVPLPTGMGSMNGETRLMN